MNRYHWATAVVVGVFTLYVAVETTFAYSTDPLLRQLRGTVIVDRGSAYTIAEPGMMLSPGDRLLILEKSAVAVTQDDCVARLAENSVFLITEESVCAAGKNGVAPQLLYAQAIGADPKSNSVNDAISAGAIGAEPDPSATPPNNAFSQPVPRAGSSALGSDEEIPAVTESVPADAVDEQDSEIVQQQPDQSMPSETTVVEEQVKPTPRPNRRPIALETPEWGGLSGPVIGGIVAAGAGLLAAVAGGGGGGSGSDGGSAANAPTNSTNGNHQPSGSDNGGQQGGNGSGPVTNSPVNNPPPNNNGGGGGTPPVNNPPPNNNGGGGGNPPINNPPPVSPE